MRIGVDAHAIGERRTGNERFTANLVRGLRAISDHELVLYFTNADAAGRWRDLDCTLVRVLRPAHPAARIPAILPFRAWRDGLDVLLVQYAGPPLVPCPLVTVVHDVAFALYPEYFSRSERLWMPRAIPFTMRRAARVVTVSHFSKDEIRRLYGIEEARVAVAPNAVDPAFANPPARPSAVEPPFFLAVGNLQPRKNLSTLVRAYRRVIDRDGHVRERLVIVGQDWFAAEELRREADDLRRAGRIVFTGYVDDHELAAMLRAATAFAYPSVYEGFGLPPLEAMAAGTAVAVSDIPVMRELFGDSALLVPARDERAWSDALARLAGDTHLRRSLSERGRRHARRFTAEAAARPVLEALESAARRRHL